MSFERSSTGGSPGSGTHGRGAGLQTALDRRVYHPLAARLAKALAPTRCTPNMVSVAGGLMVVLGGVVYIQPFWPWSALLGVVLHMSWHVLDGADGDLARLKGTASPGGEVIDGICDYLGHCALYLLLAWGSAPVLGEWVWLAAIGAGLSRIVQASYYESQRRNFSHWVDGRLWLGSAAGQPLPALLGSLASGYLGLVRLFMPKNARIERALADPMCRERLVPAIRAAGPQAFSGSTLLGANYRTLALGASMLAGSPIWYFLLELLVLNLLFVMAIRRARRALTALEQLI